jgi:hypothetical protein
MYKSSFAYARCCAYHDGSSAAASPCSHDLGHQNTRNHETLKHTKALKRRRVSLDGAVEQTYDSQRANFEEKGGDEQYSRYNAQADRMRTVDGDEACDGLTFGKRRRRRRRTRGTIVKGTKREHEGRELQDYCTGGGIAGSYDVGADNAALEPASETCGAFKACNSARVVSVGMPRFASKKASHHV